MALDEAVIALGVGFRKSCAAETLVGLVRRVLAEIEPRRPDVLATLAEKDRPVLREAAETLGLPVRILSKAALAAAGDRVTIRSPRVEACLGVPSVAEAAALAAAGPGAQLLVARVQTADATCAAAVSDES